VRRERAHWRLTAPLLDSLDKLIFVYRHRARRYYVKNGKVAREAELVEEVTGLLGVKHGRCAAESFRPVDLDTFREWLPNARTRGLLLSAAETVRRARRHDPNRREQGITRERL